MAFTNSKLATYVSISPNRTINRNQPITKITIHHMAGVCSLEEFNNIVKNPGRQMSSNYAIDKNARVGLFCEEKDRSWCSSSPWNDHRAITIEVSNSAYGDASGWPISEKVYEKLIDLCVDICQRNGIKKLEYTGNIYGSLTRHCDLAQTACPGPWIKAHTQDLCNKVNARINNQQPPVAPTQNPNTNNNKSFKKGDIVSINNGATWYTGSSIPDWVSDENWYISSISGNRAVLGLNESKDRNIQSPINTNDITLVSSGNTVKQYTVSLKSSDKIYDNNGNPKTNVGNNGVFTIIEEKTINGVIYGKLKSGAGWVITKQSSSDTDTEIKKGDKVKVVKAVQYGTDKPFTTYVSTYYVLEINGDRVVISADGTNVTAAINKNNIKKI